MSGKYQTYPKYKDSGVRWLGDVPNHWTATSVKRFAPFTTGWTPPTGNDSYFGGDHLWANISDLGPKYLSNTAKTITDAGVRATRIKKSPVGSLLFSFKLSIGLVSIVEKELYTNEAIATFEPSHTVHVPYMYWAAPLFIPQNAEENIYGAKLLNQERIANAPFVLPPSEEQRTIAAFLDHETACIDRLIEKQQRLIELLKEKRQAVISHAVTKGLDPNVPMKDSGVEWLGQVPEHWDVLAVNQATQKITNGYVGPTRDILVESGTPYVQATHIKNGKVNFDGGYFVTGTWSLKHKKSILKKGDVLVVQTGAGTGDVGLVSDSEEGYNCHALIILQPIKKKISGDYLSLVLRSAYGQSVLYSIRTGGMHPHLNCSEVKFVKLPVPSAGEQHAISEYVSDAIKKYAGLMALTQQQIQLLQERRTALISAAVTGKIDVRNWQPNTGTQAAEPDLPMAAEQAGRYHV